MEQNGRLNSWKEIATYLGRAARTVQRWEEELGLPIHRVPGKKRDLVFAFPDELDQWVRASKDLLNGIAEETNGAAENTWYENERTAISENAGASAIETDASADAIRENGALGPIPVRALPSAGTSSRPVWRNWPWAIAAVVVVCVSVVLLFAAGGWEHFVALASWDAQPASWYVSGSTLHIQNKEGRELWAHEASRRLAEFAYTEVLSESDYPLVQIVDLEGDGKNEVLFIPRSGSYDYDALHCFNADGTLRFRRNPGRSVKFGSKTFEKPYVAKLAFVTSNPQGKKTIWLGGIHFWEASVLEKLDSDGRLLAEFWHSGHIRVAREGTFRGKRAIFAGFLRNENNRASLAILDYEDPSGSAPAETERFACNSCPEGQPIAFLTFPSLETARVVGFIPKVEHVIFEGSGKFTVAVTHSNYFPTPDRTMVTSSIYTLDDQLNLLLASTGTGLDNSHKVLEAYGVIKHPYSRAEENDLYPVRKWDGKKFVSVYGPIVYKAASAKPVFPVH